MKTVRLCHPKDMEKLKTLLTEAGCYQTITIKLGDCLPEKLQEVLAFPIIDKWYAELPKAFCDN